MMRSALLNLVLVFSLFFATCEESPEGIQAVLFGVASQEVELRFSFVNDANNQIDPLKSDNGVLNWGEELYFDALVSNNLDEEIQNVELSIVGFDNPSLVSAWDENPLSFGTIPASGQAEPTTFWFSETEPYLGRTFIKTSDTGFGTSLLDINLRLTFVHDREFVEKDIIHSITIFP